MKLLILVMPANQYCCYCCWRYFWISVSVFYRDTFETGIGIKYQQFITTVSLTRQAWHQPL